MEDFADAVGCDPVPLDRAALLIGAHADPACDVDAACRHLDRLAAAVPEPDLESLLLTLFGEFGFQGDSTSYYDPRNSYLHEVLERRQGIPITLSVLAIEVARRLDVDLAGVGAPAHFLTRTISEPVVFIDAFGGGRMLDRDGVEALFAGMTPGLDVSDHLDPLPPRDILRRMLGNLVAIHRREGDRDALLWTTQLRTLIPGASVDDHRSFGAALAATGDFARAAKVLEAIADEEGVADPAREVAAAQRFRARLN